MDVNVADSDDDLMTDMHKVELRERYWLHITWFSRDSGDISLPPSTYGPPEM